MPAAQEETVERVSPDIAAFCERMRTGEREEVGDSSRALHRADRAEGLFLMPTAWRIVETGFAVRPSTGRARLYGGWWNSAGVRMVYTFLRGLPAIPLKLYDDYVLSK
jgi:hypothetical protein